MSFLKGLGKDIGAISGGVIGGMVKGVGDITGSQFIKDVGNGVEKSMQNTGKLLGDFADSVAYVGVGLIEQDNKKLEYGFDNLGKTANNFGSQIAHSAGVVLEQSSNTLHHITNGDYEQAKNSAKNLAKIGAVSLVAVGIIDAVDGFDNPNPEIVENHNSYIEVENYNTHEVTPHERTLADGRTIWVDGDGDTSVDRTTGWEQTNPNYRIKI